MRLRFFGLIFIFILWLGGFIHFYQRTQHLESKDYKKIDGLVILTGNKTRIPMGLKIFNHTFAKRILISGIDPKVTLDDMKNKHFQDKQHLLSQIDLGYSAVTTFSNALETAVWTKNHHFRTIGIVTNRIHMLRSLWIFRHIIHKVTIVPVIIEHESVELFSMLKEFHKFYFTKIAGFFIFDYSFDRQLQANL